MPRKSRLDSLVTGRAVAPDALPGPRRGDGIGVKHSSWSWTEGRLFHAKQTCIDQHRKFLGKIGQRIGAEQLPIANAADLQRREAARQVGDPLIGRLIDEIMIPDVRLAADCFDILFRRGLSVLMPFWNWHPPRS